MRLDMFDESKIIKKDSKKEPEPDNIVQRVVTEPINMPSKEIKEKKTPVFVFQHNKLTNKVEEVKNKKSLLIDSNTTVPNDQLQMFYYNTMKAINEIKFDINLLEPICYTDVFFLEKRNCLLNELKFLEIKKQALENLLK